MLNHVVRRYCSCTALALAVLSGGVLAEDRPQVSAPGFQLRGWVDDPRLGEISGLAASRRQAGVYWVHNDSLNPEFLFAINEAGEVLARVQVVGAPNLDWEDLASYSEGGEAYLALGDIGNNLGLDADMHIYLFREPALTDTQVRPVRDYRFRFSEGPRDAEGLAVDLAQRRFLIADKGRVPAGLYALPMDGSTRVATRLADIPGVRLPRTPPAAPLMAAGADAFTAMDLSADGRRLLLITYRHLLLFDRQPDEDWPAALARAPLSVRLPPRRGYEAAGWSAAGDYALITHERVPAALERWTPP